MNVAEVKELVEMVGSSGWPLIVGTGALFGFFPKFCLRQLVRVYPPGDDRPNFLLAELCERPYRLRWLFLFEQLETVVSEGLPDRFAYRRRARLAVQRSKPRWIRLNSERFTVLTRAGVKHNGWQTIRVHDRLKNEFGTFSVAAISKDRKSIAFFPPYKLNQRQGKHRRPQDRRGN